MTIDVWSYEDLAGPDPNPVDVNPNMPCYECDQSHLWKEYWKPRYVEDKSWNPGEVAWICDDCIESFKEEYTIYKRKLNHRQLLEFEE